ncbi:MAG: PaaX family transcriptional regulator C-terminal domain-containing protein [Alphaproteobacteria bacterium]
MTDTISAKRAEAAFRRIVADTHQAGEMRVWSVIISIFGDLVLPRRGDIAAGHLQAVLERLDIDAGAMRTAISRLAKEGWVSRSRTGRGSTYRLAAAAVPEFDIASRTIYAPRRPAPDGGLTLVIWPEGGDAPVHPCLVPLLRSVLAWTGTKPPPPEIAGTALVTEVAPPGVPSWMRAALLPEALAEENRSLEARFAPLAQALEGGAALSPLDAAAARALLIHRWRRVALRHPFVPAGVVPGDWPESACRASVLSLHRRLGAAAQDWLDTVLPKRDTSARDVR